MSDLPAALEDRPYAGHFEGGDHILPVWAYYEDTDAAGIVYYANFLRFMERGRSDMMRLLGVNPVTAVKTDSIAPAETLFVVRRCEVEYLRPARLSEGLEVHTTLVNVGGASVTMAQTISRDGVGVVDAVVKIACVGADGRPKRMPTQIRAAFQQLMMNNKGNSRHAG